ncbi:MAG: radical SAM protein [Planctomycetota bacterium]|nr:MAG: radical SAM protein [Planctomycetota bacterium]
MRPLPVEPPPDGRWILAQRGPRNPVDPQRPYAVLVEPERTRDGRVEDVLTVFLTNRTCPFRCLMCDLWKNTTPQRVPVGAVARQVEDTLRRHPHVRHVKLYNAGNFFDDQAISPADRRRIVDLVADRETVIIECHPRLVDDRCPAFAKVLRPRLQVAMGLETVDPDVLPRLNKQMTLADFERATRLLRAHDIDVRAFILLRAPFQSEEEGAYWAMRSIDYALALGVECCAVVPTRAGNGAMDRLMEQGWFHPPSLRSIERVLEYGIGLESGRVFMDLWDIETFAPCPYCREARIERLRAMNLMQKLSEPVSCARCGE